MLSLALGPLTLAVDHLILLASWLIATWVGTRMTRGGGQNPETALFGLLALALLAARLGFVILYWPQYRDAGWQVIDVRDGGFLFWPGLLALILGGAGYAWRKPRQRRSLLMALTSGFTLWLLATAATRLYDTGQTLPDISVTDARGRALNLRDFRGQPLVINLWATWCPPCRREMPVLLEAAQQTPGIGFMLINQGEGPQVVGSYLTSAGLDGTWVLFDSASSLSAAVGSAALPVTLFYDADGQLVRHHVGELSRASLQHALQSLVTPELH